VRHINSRGTQRSDRISRGRSYIFGYPVLLIGEAA
jgi:hypothetical protein